MKDKVKGFLLKVKMLLLMLLMTGAIVSGLLAEMWPTTKFNYPLLGVVICMILFWIIVKSL